MHRRAGAPIKGLATARLCSFCLSDARPLVGRADDFVRMCARNGWGCGGGNMHRQCRWLASDLLRAGK